jgi:hypothetical protein
VAALKWNGWQHSSGIGGSFGPEYAFIAVSLCTLYIPIKTATDSSFKNTMYSNRKTATNSEMHPARLWAHEPTQNRQQYFRNFRKSDSQH